MSDYPATQNYDMQQLMNIVGAQGQNLNNFIQDMNVFKNEVKHDIKDIKGEISDMKTNEEITCRQQEALSAAVSKRVFDLLGLPADREEWDDHDYLTYQKYSRLFHKRCWTESRRKGHIATPFRATRKGDYQAALDDIEAWNPVGGAAALKHEADELAKARLIAEATGYRNRKVNDDEAFDNRWDE